MLCVQVGSVKLYLLLLECDVCYVISALACLRDFVIMTQSYLSAHKLLTGQTWQTEFLPIESQVLIININRYFMYCNC